MAHVHGWIEVKAIVPPSDDLSPFVEILRDYGIENTLEEVGRLTGAIANVPAVHAQIEALRGALLEAGATAVETRELPEENWEMAWRQFFKPRRVGTRFVIRPTWETFDALPGDLEIVLDPGQAFGTGDHPTTRMCLELLESSAVQGATVCDVGCGSGILSVAACKLGAASVLAIDIEPISVEVAQANASMNDVTFEVRLGEGIQGAGEFEVVVSNIISAILIRLARDVYAATSRGARWIVSGIITQNWPDVLEAAQKAGFALDAMLEEDGWVGARFLRIDD